MIPYHVLENIDHYIKKEMRDITITCHNTSTKTNGQQGRDRPMMGRVGSESANISFYAYIPNTTTRTTASDLS